MANKKIELGYWRYRGLAHPLRFVLNYLELPYTEKNYFLPPGGVTQDTWLATERARIRATYPPNLPFPNIPYLVDGDLHISESRAVMRYIARTYGPQLLGTTPLIQTRVDMLENYLYDFWYMVFAHRVYENTPEAINAFNAAHPEKLRLISSFVGDNVWAAGPELTVIDFWLCEFLEHLTIYDPTLLSPYPNLQKLRDSFKQLPAIAAYMKSTWMHKKCHTDYFPFLSATGPLSCQLGLDSCFSVYYVSRRKRWIPAPYSLISVSGDS